MYQNNPIFFISSLINILINQFGHQFPGNSFIQRVIPIYTRQIGNCLTGKIYSDPSSGESFPSHHDPNCGSSPCIPESPEIIDVKFLLTRRDGKDYFIKSGDPSIKSLITGEKVVFGIHGWIENYRIDSSLNDTRDGWIKQGTDFITVDWSHANINFESAASNTRMIGALVGQLIDYLDIAEKSECVGFSFGAHACGFAGQWLKEHRGRTLASCTGLDPASRNFEGCPQSHRLDPSDCGVVKIVHSTFTPRGGILKSFGITEKSGTCDYYINYHDKDEDSNDDCPNIPVENFFSFIHRLRTDQIVILMQKLIACNHLRARNIYNRQLNSAKDDRLKAQVCSPVINDCDSNVVPMKNESHFVPIPPFDDCSNQDYFNACACLFS